MRNCYGESAQVIITEEKCTCSYTLNAAEVTVVQMQTQLSGILFCSEVLKTSPFFKLGFI